MENSIRPMEISIKPPLISSSNPCIPCFSPRSLRFKIKGNEAESNFRAFSTSPLGSRCTSSRIRSSLTPDLQRSKSSLESLFCYDKSVPEENIEEPIGLSLDKREIGNKPPCVDCQAKGAVLCTTCSGSGLYVDSILESQGVIVKVRCLGCGGTGNIMCSGCRGRGHTEI